jgi:hypothetical protein
VQQERVADADAAEISVGPTDDAFEREAERAADVAMAAEPDGLPSAHAAPPLTSVNAPIIQRKTCGPKVDTQVRDVWTQIGTDFKSWTDKQAEAACSFLVKPLLQEPATTPRGELRKADVPLFDPFGRPHKLSIPTRLRFNVDAFDTLPLFYNGAIIWLMDPDLLARGCCDPSISQTEASDPDNFTANQKRCEARDSCCSTVQIGNKCWLSGTVNYGTYGIMVSLCKKRFPIRYVNIYHLAKFELKSYKKLGKVLSGATTEEFDIEEPLSWFEATFSGGPGATSARAGNHPGCELKCPFDGSIESKWDYVWEPVKKRDVKNFPVKPVLPP